tara:strand:- start:103 stop:381 length:279 start_codon:yes stop_codon:yes gene_type:complete
MNVTQKQCFRTLRRHPEGLGVSTLARKANLVKSEDDNTSFIKDQLLPLELTGQLTRTTTKQGRTIKWYTTKHWNNKINKIQKRNRIFQLNLF